MLPGQRLHHRSLAIACVVCTGIVMALHVTGFVTLQRFEYQWQDWMAQFGRRAPTDPRLVFLAIDAASQSLDTVEPEELAESPALQRMKEEFPWKRDVYAHIINRLVDAGAAAVILDMRFPTPREGDEEFAAALQRHRGRVVIGSNFPETARHAQTMGVEFPSDSLLPGAGPEDDRVGFVTVWPDPDDVLRRAHYRRKLMEVMGLPPLPDEPVYESLAARAVRKAGEAPRIPAGTEARLIRFAYPPPRNASSSLDPRSIYEIFARGIWEKNYAAGAFFKGKIVVVGPEGNWSKDVVKTPFGLIAGPVFHLNAINALLRGEFLRETSLGLNLLIIAASGALAALLSMLVREPITHVAVLLIAAAAWCGAALLLFNAGIYTIVLSPILALVSSGFSFSVAEQVINIREKARLRRTFERYVSRDVVKELIDNPQSYLNTVGGARKQVTVMFSDVRGFTTITESGDAQQLVAQLNEYFDHMVEIVFANRGTLDKFIGDAVMAWWGGIETDGEKQDAINAVRTAVQMRKKLKELNPVWLAKGMLEIKFGIGINNGEAIAGNLGSKVKAEISVIGDPVNTASRLEGITKEYHTDLIIGESVAALVRDTFHLRTAGLNQPKGKTKPLELFTVLDERNGTPPPAWLEAHEQGVRLFRARDFAGAAACFEAVLKELPDDWLAGEYLADCREFEKNPPPPDWNAVKVMKSK